MKCLRISLRPECSHGRDRIGKRKCTLLDVAWVRIYLMTTKSEAHEFPMKTKLEVHEVPMKEKSGKQEELSLMAQRDGVSPAIKLE